MRGVLVGSSLNEAHARLGEGCNRQRINTLLVILTWIILLVLYQGPSVSKTPAALGKQAADKEQAHLGAMAQMDRAAVKMWPHEMGTKGWPVRNFFESAKRIAYGLTASSESRSGSINIIWLDKMKSVHYPPPFLFKYLSTSKDMTHQVVWQAQRLAAIRNVADAVFEHSGL